MTPQELKTSILQLAIQGKLVEQRPEEGTAEELYRQIQKEKQQLVKEGKIKKEKPLLESAEDAKPFDIPEGWMWASVIDCGSFISGYTPKPEHLTTTGTIPYFKVADMNRDGNELYLSVTDFYLKNDDSKRYLANTIVYPKNGGAVFTNKKRILVHDSVVDLNTGGYYPITPNDVMFVYTFFSTIDFRQCSKGTALPTVDMDKLKRKWMPLPPLAEQKRIVAKIEELLPYIDRYEQAWTRLEELNKRFPSDLQKSILQWAIQGKLVEQRPEEVTAEELYRRIQEEKQRLVKEGKIKKEKPLPEIAENEVPFEIPGSWKWVRFGSIMINRDSERVPLSVSERNKLEKCFDYYGASGIIDKVDRYLFDKTLLLIGEDGANLLARSTPIAFLAKGKYWVNNHAHVLDCVEDTLSLEYMMYFVNAISLAKYVTGTAQPKMNQEKMNSILVSLPPPAEQKRIVAKLEELLPLCERLK